jgi:F420-non-reducing hydrogenase iron-sulfur subunit
MCSGRVDLAFVLRAFSNGMDGVIIGGCRLKECNYSTQGNYDALNMVLLCKGILKYIGLNPERLGIEFMSAGEGILFAERMNAFVDNVSGLGPLGQGEGIDETQRKARLEAVVKLVPHIKMAEKDKLAARLDKEEEYRELFTGDEIERLFREVVSYRIDPDQCRACMICLRKCPVGAVEGGKNRVHVIQQEKCIKCGTCFESCPPRFAAVRKTSGEPFPPHIPEKDQAARPLPPTRPGTS